MYRRHACRRKRREPRRDPWRRGSGVHPRYSKLDRDSSSNFDARPSSRSPSSSRVTLPRRHRVSARARVTDRDRVDVRQGRTPASAATIMFHPMTRLPSPAGGSRSAKGFPGFRPATAPLPFRFRSTSVPPPFRFRPTTVQPPVSRSEPSSPPSSPLHRAAGALHARRPITDRIDGCRGEHASLVTGCRRRGTASASITSNSRRGADARAGTASTRSRSVEARPRRRPGIGLDATDTPAAGRGSWRRGGRSTQGKSKRKDAEKGFSASSSFPPPRPPRSSSARRRTRRRGISRAGGGRPGCP